MLERFWVLWVLYGVAFGVSGKRFAQALEPLLWLRSFTCHESNKSAKSSSRVRFIVLRSITFVLVSVVFQPALQGEKIRGGGWNERYRCKHGHPLGATCFVVTPKLTYHNGSI